jgi:hypothetical protein
LPFSTSLGLAGVLFLQHLFFGHTQVGDLRPYLSGFFDTTSGAKQEADSYQNIYLTIGADQPQEVGMLTMGVRCLFFAAVPCFSDQAYVCACSALSEVGMAQVSSWHWTRRFCWMAFGPLVFVHESIIWVYK